MQLRTTEQNKELHVLLFQLHIDLDDKEDLVEQYTDGRTKRSSQMSLVECSELIRVLRQKQTQNGRILDRQRKRVIAHLAEAGYQHADGRPDMPGIHAWVRRQKYKKHLNEHSSRELSTLIYASAKVRDHYLSKVREDMDDKSPSHA